MNLELKNTASKILDAELYSLSPLGDRLASSPSPAAKWLGRELAIAWTQLLSYFEQTPIVQEINGKTITIEGYRATSLNMCQQIREGSCWITRAASSMDAFHEPLRNALIKHAAEEHLDFHMLERDFVSVGGSLDEIKTQPKNVGSEALSAYIFQIASEPNPIHVLGATFIIEGVGTKFAMKWAENIKAATGLTDQNVSFLVYHGKNDVDHYANLVKLLQSPYITPLVACKIAKTARVVARLYALQLAELNNI